MAKSESIGLKYIFTESKKHELLSNVTNDFVGDDFEYVEVYSLAKGSAFTNNGNISFFHGEGG